MAGKHLNVLISWEDAICVENDEPSEPAGEHMFDWKCWKDTADIVNLVPRDHLYNEDNWYVEYLFRQVESWKLVWE